MSQDSRLMELDVVQLLVFWHGDWSGWVEKLVISFVVAR